MRAVLIGNYGAGNLGDELLKEYMLNAFPEVAWTVVSARPGEGEVPRLPLGLRSLFRPWWRTLRAIRKSDAVVFGGGTLFTDHESLKACILWGLHAKAARFFKKPVLLAFQGFGPFMSRRGERIAKNILRSARFISTRDDEAKLFAESVHSSTKIIQSFDSVFDLFHAKKSPVRSKNVLTIVPRENSGETFKKAVHDALKTRSFSEVKFLSLKPEDMHEKNMCEQIRQSLSLPSSVISVRTMDDLLKGISDAELIVSQRYHASLAALATGVPCISVPQKIGDKLYELRHLSQKDVPTLLERVKIGEKALRDALASV